MDDGMDIIKITCRNFGSTDIEILCSTPMKGIQLVLVQPLRLIWRLINGGVSTWCFWTLWILCVWSSSILQGIHGLFQKKPTVIVISNSDIQSSDSLGADEKQLIDGISVENGIPVISISNLTEEGFLNWRLKHVSYFWSFNAHKLLTKKSFNQEFLKEFRQCWDYTTWTKKSCVWLSVCKSEEAGCHCTDELKLS